MYRRGLKTSLKNHFKERFARLEELLETLPAALPHTKLSDWDREEDVGESGARLRGGEDNKVLNITIAYARPDGRTYLLRAELSKGRAFGAYERAFANCIAREIGTVVDTMARDGAGRILVSAQDVVDSAVSDFLKQTTKIEGPDYPSIIRFLKELAQQSYENKPITYGILVLPRRESKENVSEFPQGIFR